MANTMTTGPAGAMVTEAEKGELLAGDGGTGRPGDRANTNPGPPTPPPP
ncbi:MAG: hypothetical protein HYY04_05075, partial [Chloroflexi bacterium]|nr:hypothetical protein [Chloroflexota bacterium]